MQLTTRDKVLLHHLCRHNLLSTKQIQAEVFPALDLSTVMRRLRKLQAGGLVVRLGMLSCRTWVWGCSQLSNELFTGFTSSHRTNLNTLHHDVALTDLRLFFEKITRVDDWYDIRHIKNCVMPEPFYIYYNSRNYNFHKGESALVPDALFFGFKNDKPFTCALELELSIKASYRYDKILSRYDGKEEPSFIIYVVENESIRNSVLRTAFHSMRKPRKVLTVLLSDLLRMRDNAELQIVDNSKVRFHEIFDCKTRRDVHELAHEVGKLMGNPLESIRAAQLTN